MKKETTESKANQPIWVRRSGRICFTAETERRFYFFLTLAMLAAGILYKTGVF